MSAPMSAGGRVLMFPTERRAADRAHRAVAVIEECRSFIGDVVDAGGVPATRHVRLKVGLAFRAPDLLDAVEDLEGHPEGPAILESLGAVWRRIPQDALDDTMQTIAVALGELPSGDR